MNSERSRNHRKLFFTYYAQNHRSASVKNVLKTSEFLSEYKEVTLLTTFSPDLKEELKELFDVKKEFNIESLGKGSNSQILEKFDRMIFAATCLFVIYQKGIDEIYTRDPLLMILFSFTDLIGSSKTVIYEAHNPYSIKSYFPEVLESFLLRSANKVYCVSEGVKEDLEQLSKNKDKFELQRNCVESCHYKEVKETNNKLEECKIVYIGSFSRKKGVDTLIEAFRKLKSKKKDSTLVLVGKERKWVRQKTKDISDVEVTGFVSQDSVLNYIQEANILVMPSNNTIYQRRYTCPMKLLEYMASGKPVVAADLDSVRWIAKNTINYYDPTNLDDLTNSFIDIIDNGYSISKLNEAQKLVLRNYTWELKAERIKDDLEKIRQYEY